MHEEEGVDDRALASAVSFSSLNKTVSVHGKDKKILTNVSGSVRGDEIMAVMGTSGSGKTTLLEVLGGRNQLGVTGEVILGGMLLEKKYRKSLAYVKQEDVFLQSPFITVRNHLDFSAIVRNKDSMPYTVKMGLVDEVVKLLGLKSCENTPFLLVSGGEKKRTNIGTELLVSNPRLLLVDEGTSGLDSAAALSLMRVLRGIQQQKHIPIVMSVHQPNDQIMNAFDKVLIMSRGKPVYYGPPRCMLSYLGNLGFSPLSEYITSADFMLCLLHQNPDSTECPYTYSETAGPMIGPALSPIKPLTQTKTKTQTQKQRSRSRSIPVDNTNNTNNTNNINSSSIGAEGASSSSSSSWRNSKFLVLPKDVLEASYDHLPALKHFNSIKEFFVDKGKGKDKDEDKDEDKDKDKDKSSSNSNSNSSSPSPFSLSPSHTRTKERQSPYLQPQPQSQSLSQSLSQSHDRDRDIEEQQEQKEQQGQQQQYEHQHELQGPQDTDTETDNIGTGTNTSKDKDKDKDTADTTDTTDTTEVEVYPSSWCTQYLQLTKRSYQSNKSGRISVLNVSVTIVLALVVGIAWYQVPATESRARDRSGFLFFTSSYWFFVGIFNGMLEFIPERKVLKKERESGLYHLSAYFSAKSTGTVPVRVLLPVIFSIIIFPMVIPAKELLVQQWFAFVSLAIISAFTGESIGLFIGTLTLDLDIAIAIATVTTLGILLLGGFYIRSLPVWLDWLKYTSPLRYAYSASVQIMWLWGSPITCEDGSFIGQCTAYPYVGTVSGEEVMNWLSITKLTIGQNFLVLIVYLVMFRIFGYLSLRFIRFNIGRT